MRHEAIIRARAEVPAAVALWPLVLVAVWPAIFPLDDAYITLSNARALVSGVPDPIYGSSYLTGATSAVHLALVGLIGLIVQPEAGLLLLGLVGAALYTLALIRIAAGLSPWRARALVFIGAAWGYALFNYLNGLETSLAMATSGWLVLWRDDKVRLPFLAGLAPFVRPELAVLAALLMVRLCYSLKANKPQLVRALLLGLVVALPWAAWMMAETGRPLPSTIAAKLAFYQQARFAPFIKATIGAKALFGSMQLPLFLGLLGLKQDHWPECTFIVVVMVTIAVLMPDAFLWNEGRYIATFTPILMLGIANLASLRTPAGDLLLKSLVVGTVLTAAYGAAEYVQEIGYARQVRDHARFVATLPSSAVVMVHDAGWVAWERPKARLVDVVGLKTPSNIAIHQRLTHRDCAWSEALDAIATRQGATHLVDLNRWNWPCLAANMRQAGWQLTPVYTGYYSVYSITRSGNKQGRSTR